MEEKVALYFIQHLPESLLQKITLMYLGHLMAQSSFGEEIVSDITIRQIVVAMKEKETQWRMKQ